MNVMKIDYLNLLSWISIQEVERLSYKSNEASSSVVVHVTGLWKLW